MHISLVSNSITTFYGLCYIKGKVYLWLFVKSEVSHECLVSNYKKNIPTASTLIPGHRRTDRLIRMTCTHLPII
jgi:hypothetical protein